MPKKPTPDTPQPKGSKVTQRSPNYPSVSLPKAVEKVAALFEQANRSSIPISVACQYMGVRSTSSTGARLVSALQDFGLVRTEGRGKDRMLTVTEAARTILKHPDRESMEYQVALRDAALGPKIYQKFWERWKEDGLPPDAALSYELQKPEWGFTDSAARSVIAGFRETVAFAGLTTTPSEEHDVDEDEDPPPAPDGLLQHDQANPAPNLPPKLQVPLMP
ncbi:MAG: hypothetical protein QM477_08760, partial [Planctomycetota bacterium]